MHFWALIFKNLIRRPLRSALTLIALTTAIACVVSLFGISRGFTRSFADIYAAHSVDIVVSRQGSADRLSSSIDQGFAEKIGQIPGVLRTAAVLLETMSLEQDGIYGIPTMGIASQSWLRNDYELVDQIDINQGANDLSSVASKSSLHLQLGIHLAERLNKRPGESVDLFDEAYLVTGIFKSPSTWENGSMILPIEQLQQLTDRAGQATFIDVVLKSPVSGSSASHVLQQIQALDARLLPLATAEFVESDTRMKLAGAMAWMTSMIALVIGSIGTLNTMLTSVMERTKEIGILRAIGWPKTRVVRMILLESCSLAILASVFGTLLAMVLTWSLSQAPATRGILSPSIDGPIIVQGFVLSVGIGLLGALLPAWRAARLLPTEAFREN